MGAAVIFYNDDGKVKIEEYYINGKNHREDGPAYIEHSTKRILEEYHLKDKLISFGDIFSFKKALEEYKAEEILRLTIWKIHVMV